MSVSLNDREKRILIWLAKACTYETIARKEGIGERHVRRIALGVFDRLGARNPAEAVAQAFVKGVLTKADIPPTDEVRLEPREIDVLKLLGKGYGQVDVERALGITSKAFRVYTSGARRKLGVKTTRQAIEIAASHDLL